MDETYEYLKVPDEKRNVLLTLCLKLEEEGITNEVEVNCGFMSHMKRHPEEVDSFLNEFEARFRRYVEDAE